MKFLITFVFLLISQAEAQVFNVEITDYGGTDSIPALKRYIDSEVQKLEDQINEDIPVESPHEIMNGMANSNVLAAKGLGTDYASYMDVFLVGAGIGAAADFEKENSLGSDIVGVGAAAGFVAGVNLDKINVHEFVGLDTKKLNVYFNMINTAYTYEARNDGGVESDINTEFLNIGLHFRYDWVEGSGDPQFGWGGLKLHWGYEFSDASYMFTNKLDRVINAVDATQGNINGRITGQPKYEISTQTHSIPLEVSTDLRMLNFFTLFGGLGTDINYGKAQGKGVVDGDVTPLICTGGGFCGGSQIIEVQAKANVDAEAHVDPLFLRGFLGMQFNIPYFRIYAQANKVFGTKLLGANVGLRFVY